MVTKAGCNFTFLKAVTTSLVWFTLTYNEYKQSSLVMKFKCIIRVEPYVSFPVRHLFNNVHNPVKLDC